MEDKSALLRSGSYKLGKYEVRQLLGKGSMGMVFHGHDPVLERDVAIKVMSGSVDDEQGKQRFEREAKAVAQLHHPNIVTVHDLGYDPWGYPFIAMELLEGTDLDELLESSPNSFRRKLEIMVEVCRGLGHAHRHGIVHRDIKPTNIFVACDGSVKIMDFGVARWTKTSQTQAGIVVGTAGYMPPEQLRGKAVDGRSDLFSLGVVLVEILTDQVLFPGDTIERIFFQTLSKPIPLVMTPDGEEIPELQEIVNRTLAKEAEGRYSSAEELEKAIQSFLSSCGGSFPDRTVLMTKEGADADNILPVARPEPEAERRTVVSAPVLKPVSVRDSPSVKRRYPTHRGSRRGRRPLLAALMMLLAAGVGAYLLVLRKPAKVQSDHAESETTTPQPPSAPVGGEALEQVDGLGPTPRETAAILAADAALALGNGDIGEARTLIARGEELDADNPRWAALRDQIRIKEIDARRKADAVNRLREAALLLEEGDYARAIDAYQKAMEADPQSREARIGLTRAVDLQRETEKTIERPAAPARQFVESETEFTPGTTDSSNELQGFEMEEGLNVKETADPFYPAKVVIELEPTDARPGESYFLRVSVFNEGYHAIDFESLELVSRFGGKTVGKSQPIAVRNPQVGPRSSVVLHEIEGIWKETQNHGEIEAIVTIGDGGRLTKRVRW
jgi:serine/threonine protein kinase